MREILVAFDEAVLERLEAVAAGRKRAGFIRAAVEAALSGGMVAPDAPAPKPAARSVAKPEGLSAHAKVVLGLVRERKSMTLNDAARGLGLVPRAVDRAAEELRKAGLVRLDGFVLELVG
jgi:hypothetical protein